MDQQPADASAPERPRGRLVRAQLARANGLPAPVAEAAQQALANHADSRDELVYNDELSPTVWCRLWGTKRPEVGVAVALVDRPLDRARRDIVLARETRTKVLRTLIARNVLDADEQQHLAGHHGVEDALLAARWLAAEWRKPLALRAGGIALLTELAYGPDGQFDDDETADLLARFADWKEARKQGAQHLLLRVLFGRRPELIDRILADPNVDDTLVVSAAGSANITADQCGRLAVIRNGTCMLGGRYRPLRYALLALVANPRCPVDVADAVGAHADADADIVAAVARRRSMTAATAVGPIRGLDDAQQLAWYVRRSLPADGDWGRRVGRPVELLELAANPHLTGHDLDAVLRAVADDVDDVLVDRYRSAIDAVHPGALIDRQVEPHLATMPVWRVNVMAAYAAHHLGADQASWETLVGLLDDFDGEFADLVDVARDI